MRLGVVQSSNERVANHNDLYDGVGGDDENDNFLIRAKFEAAVHRHLRLGLDFKHLQTQTLAPWHTRQFLSHLVVITQPSYHHHHHLSRIKM